MYILNEIWVFTLILIYINKVHNEYLEKARKADIKWNNTPQNAVGPIESRLNEFGTVLPFVFGYLGEANKAVRTLLKEIATVAAR